MDNLNNLKIEIVHFDDGVTPESMQAYIRVSGLTKAQLKNKGSTVLDVGNYLYRKYGIIYHHPPVYSRSTKEKNTLCFYVSKKAWVNMPHLQGWLLGMFNKGLSEDLKTTRASYALYNKREFVIQLPSKEGEK